MGGLAIFTFATPGWWIAGLGALVITLAIYFVSCVPPAEKRAALKPGWKDYKRSTSVLIPWFR